MTKKSKASWTTVFSLVKPETQSDYVKLFNDIGKIMNHGISPDLQSDDVMLEAKRVHVRLKLGPLGTAILDLDREKFDESIAKLVDSLVRHFSPTLSQKDIAELNAKARLM